MGTHPTSALLPWRLLLCSLSVATHPKVPFPLRSLYCDFITILSCNRHIITTNVSFEMRRETEMIQLCSPARRCVSDDIIIHQHSIKSSWDLWIHNKYNTLPCCDNIQPCDAHTTTSPEILVTSICKEGLNHSCKNTVFYRQCVFLNVLSRTKHVFIRQQLSQAEL